MNERNESTALGLFKFFIFSLVFIVIGCVICSLWSYLGQSISSGARQTFLEAKPTVVLDPGHGGPDGGTSGFSAVPEKELNLDIALKVRDILTTSGIEVVMTRTEDMTLTDPDGGTRKNQDLRARKKIAEATPNAILVSIHMNAFSIEKYSGLQVYYSKNNEKSQVLAKSVQTSVAHLLQPENNRKIKAAGESIYLLNELDCPAILIECGFLSNAAESERLNTPEYRQALAFIIANSIIDGIYQNAS